MDSSILNGIVSSAQTIFDKASQLPIYAHIAIVLLGLPILAISINVAWQILIPRDPSLPPQIFYWVPWLGSAVSYGMDPLDFLLQNRQKHGDVFTFVLLGRKMTVALGAKGNNFILGGKLAHISAEEAYTHLTTPVFGEGVVYDVPNHVLMEQKRFVKFGLNTDNFRAYVDLIEEEVDNLLNTHKTFEAYRTGDKNPEAWGKFHVFHTMAELTICTAARTLQGEEVRNSLDGSFANYYMDLDRGFTPINMMFPNLPLPSYRKRDKAQKRMSDFYVNIMEKRKGGDHQHDHDMLAALETQTYKDGRPLRQREMAHIMIALLMAGQHTSSATSSWSILHLADRPDVWQALYEEQVQHFSNPDGTLRSMTYEELKTLPLMDSVIRESLRMHPPLHSLMRKVIADLPVPTSLAAPTNKKTASSGYVIPKGYFVLSSPAVSQMDPLIWKNPKEWDPYRWSDPEGVAAQAGKVYDGADGEKIDYGYGAISKGTDSPYLPFGAGRHRCIGEQFAYVQLGTILGTLVRRLELKMDHPVPGHDYTTLLVLPLEPCDAYYRKRH